MDTLKIKHDMMELWKETFHDSKFYIDLVFDAYFSLDNICVRYEGERLVAALLSVDYRFLMPSEDGGRKVIWGCYLCGLATRPEYRRQGIMTSLMHEAENRAKSKGCALTFLIPADDHLRAYYNRHGYRDASYRKTYVFEKEKSECDSSLYIYSVRDFLKNGKSEFAEGLAEWCRIREKHLCGAALLHSQRDMMAVLSENENTFFLADCSFDPEHPILAKVASVVFPVVSEEGKIKIIDIFLDRDTEEESCIGGVRELPDEIRKAILKKYNDREVEFAIPYSGVERTMDSVSPYAMIKWVGDNAKFANYENLTFRISLMLD